MACQWLFQGEGAPTSAEDLMAYRIGFAGSQHDDLVEYGGRWADAQQLNSSDSTGDEIERTLSYDFLELACTSHGVTSGD